MSRVWQKQTDDLIWLFVASIQCCSIDDAKQSQRQSLIVGISLKYISMMKILYLLSYMLIERKNLQYIESNLCVIRINKIAGCFQFVVRRNIALAIHLLARVSMMFKVDHGCNKRSLLFFIQVTFLRFLTFFFTFSTFFYLKKNVVKCKV